MFGRNATLERGTMQDHESKLSSTTPDLEQPMHRDTESTNSLASSLHIEERTQGEAVAQAPPEGGLVAWLAGKLNADESKCAGC
jgi:hypothetical protein